ncbi:hypothetical protein K9L16_02675 [Candidatus Pacearchaeota archaeon]|nr:hypothetical protein [Candidatus Pacearchaeota archaeon]
MGKSLKQKDFKEEKPLKDNKKEVDMAKSSKKTKYIYAYDPKIKRRVVHIVKQGKAISLVTGNKFKYKPRKKK